MPSPKPGPLARASDLLKLACPLSSWNGLLTAIPTSRRSMVPRRSMVWVNREGQPCHHAVWSRTSSCSAAGNGTETEEQSVRRRTVAAERERSGRSPPVMRRRHARGGGGAGLPPVRCSEGRR
jgi:hypothetical protein